VLVAPVGVPFGLAVGLRDAGYHWPIQMSGPS
jgi:hypothetical protein